MKAFTCTCGQPLFFDNLRCLACGSDVAYDPHTLRLTAVASEGSGLWSIVGDVRTPRQASSENREIASYLGVTKQERALVEPFSPQPGSDLVIALAGVA